MGKKTFFLFLLVYFLFSRHTFTSLGIRNYINKTNPWFKTGLDTEVNTVLFSFKRQMSRARRCQRFAPGADMSGNVG